MSALPEVDPALIAIAEWRQAFAAYTTATTNAEFTACAAVECRAALTALTTVPITLAGLRAFCMFGADAARDSRENSKCGLADWMPGIPLGESHWPSAEQLFMETLERAALSLLPSEGKPVEDPATDPLMRALDVYRAELIRTDELPESMNEEEYKRETQLWMSIYYAPSLPQPTTVDGARDALSAAIAEDENLSGFSLNLIKAALAYLDGLGRLA